MFPEEYRGPKRHNKTRLYLYRRAKEFWGIVGSPEGNIAWMRHRLKLELSDQFRLRGGKIVLMHQNINYRPYGSFAVRAQIRKDLEFLL